MRLVHVRTISFVMHDEISKFFGTNDHHDKTMCHEQEPCRKVKGLCHSLHLTLCIDFSETC